MAGNDRKKAKVWKVEVEGQPVLVVTIEHGLKKPSMCEGCSAPCCKGRLRPVLTEEEFKTRKFPILFLEVPEFIKKQVPRAQAIATLGNFTDTGCSYYDKDVGVCLIWPNCPDGCGAYDCREDTRPEISEFAARRVAQWRAQ